MKRLFWTLTLAFALISPTSSGEVATTNSQTETNNVAASSSSSAKAVDKIPFHGLQYWLIYGVVALAVGAFVYGGIWYKHKDCLSPMKFPQKVAHLISHVPDDESSPWPHVFAGVLVFSGICLIVGYAIAVCSFVADRYDAHGTALTAAGLIFGVLIAFISFWTLWQTKRIEQLQGANIDGFRTLTRSITTEIEELIVDFERHGKSASSHHRIYLVTTNPDFGGLSFPFTPDQENFYMALLKAADMASQNPAQDANKRFQLHVLCGDETTVNKFNEQWLKKNEAESRLTGANARVTRFIQELNTHAGTEVIKRKANIPEMQFAIVGHTVFEFILYIQEHGGTTGIAGARKIEDGLVCRRFINHFEALKG